MKFILDHIQVNVLFFKRLKLKFYIIGKEMKAVTLEPERNALINGVDRLAKIISSRQMRLSYNFK